MSTKQTGLTWSSVAAVMFLAFAAIYVAPAFQTTENATVYLGDCTEKECALTGDLTTNVWTRQYELTREDGSIVIFAPEQARMMTWPVPDKDQAKESN
ncbi:hypothetical protein AWH63_11075 [Marinobacter sp. C18]|uniref:hypothetical protein n=1 Tax=Marinobacter sp. C18 TaxID=1772288 RepID=UPI000948BDF2|nr:hypothetical protein [Marinobacter sp. C18]OLF82074.1 hypothetical protein AWH63_11075 [Marinobacter sp. C18]